MIVIIDTGGANLASIGNALSRLEQDWQVSANVEVIRRASKVILPGVGTARESMARIEYHGLLPVIRRLEQPVLGICLGMQLLFEASEEGASPCLGIIPGIVRHIPRTPGLSLPHIGWNRLQLCNPSHAMVQNIEQNAWFYFVHSYFAEVNDYTQAYCTFGCDIAALVQKDNFWGAQFHPERSALTGSQFLRNFLAL